MPFGMARRPCERRLVSTKGTLQTKFGEIEYNACGGADYVFLGTINPIMVFGVEYTGNYRMKRVDGAWVSEGYSALYLSRRENFNGGSPAACKAVREAFGAAWTSFVEANPGVLDQAAVEKVESEIARLEGERHETWELYQQLGTELDIKHKGLAALKDRIATKRFTGAA